MKKSFNLIFCNRNDGYAQNQDLRIKTFIEYYSRLKAEDFDLFFTIIDWNPPIDKPSLQQAFSWDKLKRVSHIVVSPEEHKKRFPKNRRKINDYTGRNLGIVNSTCDFNVVLNQDIYIESNTFSEIAHFEEGKFYFRSDRFDIPESSLDDVSKLFQSPVLTVHSRLIKFPLNHLAKNGRILFFEKLVKGCFVQRFSFIDKIFLFAVKIIKNALNLFLSPANKLTDLDFLFLHMNASGDFIIIPNNSKDKLLYPETEDFYMHTDGYILVRLAAAGYRQVIMGPSHRILHIDHSRPDRSTDIPYEYHEKEFLKILNERKL